MHPVFIQLFAYFMLLPFLHESKSKSVFCKKNTKSIQITVNDSTPDIRIIYKPINYNEERKKLSIRYLQERHGISQTSPRISPSIIVLHYTGGGSINSTFNYFNQIKIEQGRAYNNKYSQLNVSSQYLVDRDGTIYQLVDDTLFARHTIGLNYCAIGVENIGGPKNPLTHEQVIANVKLIRMLSNKYPIKYVIGHSEYGRFRKSAVWKEKDSSYFTHKQDPGDEFLKQVRRLIADLKMKETPDD